MDRIVDIYFVGGFGTVQWIDAEEYLASRPDEVLVVENPARTLQASTRSQQEEGARGWRRGSRELAPREPRVWAGRVGREGGQRITPRPFLRAAPHRA